MSHTERNERPIRRWISWVRPDCVPLAASRVTRSPVEPGRSEYSAVTHPLPLPRIHGGTRSSTEAVQSTRVRPIETSTEPGAKTVKSRSKVGGRSSSMARPSARGRLVLPALVPSLTGRTPFRSTLAPPVARRWPRLGADGRRVDRRPAVGDHQPPRAGLAGLRSRLGVRS